ncbi:MocR-like pyridoxine biosynthesis transcription factor PdxR [Paenibacillus harenae]|uniref:GntR family transcriptional regulator/MocR family aminotransferase n=1 Tax=Paenibacillus harenae TaxID=306543 RepID=A0ABT9U3F8_PAEHA|nr:PLP-dependent aminotransferase family protein [Paenibacillus harenae]MDQ0112824.1 GntR family transcriptional regulator/MocR family aminotransferase [Paenibacillus harenae]
MSMIAISPILDKQGNQPIYFQLYKYIRSQIEAGLLVEGVQLPAIRQLALHLGVSKNTIESAYQQLLSEGYIDSKQRGGYRVLPLEELVWPITEPDGTDNYMPATVTPKAPLSNVRYDFQYGDMDIERFPHEAWKSCLVDAVSRRSSDVLGYGHFQGDVELREEIARYVFESRGVHCKPEQIVVCAGTQHSVSMLCQILSLRERRIGMEEPGYSGVKTVLRNHGCSISPIKLEHDGIHVEGLYTEEVQVAYVTPSHQFPVGMVLPIHKRTRLLQWAIDCDGLLLEDDYDSEFRYYGQPVPALKALDTAEKVIYMGTLSKSFLPAARLSYLVLPSRLMASVQSKLASYSQPVSPIIQKAVTLFMKRGHFARHIRKMKRIYHGKHKAVTVAIQRWMGEFVEVIGDRSGLHLLLDVKGRDSAELLQLAERVDCRVYSPVHHWNNADDCPPGYIMIGFGGMEEAQLEDGIRRLSEAWFGCKS